MDADSSQFEHVEIAAASLSALERKVLFLSANLGLHNDDIAGLLGISERRVERLLGRALRKFDRALRRRSTQKEKRP